MLVKIIGKVSIATDYDDGFTLADISSQSAIGQAFYEAVEAQHRRTKDQS